MKAISWRFWTIVLVAGGLANAALADDMWRARGPATSFVPDWSKADRTDAAATAQFLKHVWPKLGPAAEALNAKLKAKTDAVYRDGMSDAERAAGVVCFPLRVEQILPWYAVPTAEQIRQRKLALFAARGQSEAVCVAVHALRDVKSVTVTCSELKGPGTIAASAVTTRLSLAYTVNPRNRSRNIHARQMLLLKVDGWDIAKGRTCEWVVDVHVPADTKAGAYRGKVKVLAGGNAAAEFDLEMEVLPFALTDNGCRWGAFMTPPPGPASEAWCDLNARYGFNSLAWWKLDDPRLTWTWDGIKHDELVFCRLRDKDEKLVQVAALKSAPPWLVRRWDGFHLVLKADEVVGLPANAEARKALVGKAVKLKPELGTLPPRLAAMIRYGHSLRMAKFHEKAMDSVRFEHNKEFKRFDAGMKRLAKHGFAGPNTWFGSGSTSPPWEIRVIYHRFGQRYSRKGWKWTGKVDRANTNHLWYFANAAVAKSFARAGQKYGWPEVVWCPNDEAMQHRGATGRSCAAMIGEMMPYVKRYAPGMRVYAVVWHTKADNWRGRWQCGEYQKIATRKDGSRSHTYGPFGVICTNCPNDLDRKTTWDAGGEYWIYVLVYSVVPDFSAARFGMGFKGARHHAAVVYSYADRWTVHNVAPGDDVGRSAWIAGEAQTNYYLTKTPDAGRRAPIDYAIASHAMLACRQGITDRKYIETLRTWAWKKKSASDIAWVKNIGERIARIGGGGKGGVDDFTAKVTDESGAQKLRREIAMRIKALVTK